MDLGCSAVSKVEAILANLHVHYMVILMKTLRCVTNYHALYKRAEAHCISFRIIILRILFKGTVLLEGRELIEYNYFEAGNLFQNSIHE